MAKCSDPAADFDSKPDSALVDDKTVAAVFGIHRNSVWRLAREGRLPAPVRVTNHTTRWRVVDLRKALASLTPA